MWSFSTWIHVPLSSLNVHSSPLPMNNVTHPVPGGGLSLVWLLIYLPCGMLDSNAWRPVLSLHYLLSLSLSCTLVFLLWNVVPGLSGLDSNRFLKSCFLSLQFAAMRKNLMLCAFSWVSFNNTLVVLPCTGYSNIWPPPENTVLKMCHKLNMLSIWVLEGPTWSCSWLVRGRVELGDGRKSRGGEGNRQRWAEGGKERRKEREVGYLPFHYLSWWANCLVEEI